MATEYIIGFDPFASMALFIMAIAVLVLVVTIVTVRRTKAYRQELSDMYICGKIKQIAKKDGIDINQEYKDFTKAWKVKKIDDEALDSTIERKLQEAAAVDGDDIIIIDEKKK